MPQVRASASYIRSNSLSPSSSHISAPPNPFTVSLLYSSSAAVFSSLRLLSSQLVDPPFSYLLYPPLKALAHLHKFVRGCSLSVFTFRWGADLKG